MNIERIKGLHKVVERALAFSDSTLDYNRTLDAITLLAEWVAEYPGEGEDVWYLDGLTYKSITDIFSGAYWFAADYHGGQASPEYAMSSTISNVFDPGMSSYDADSAEGDVYRDMEALHNEANQSHVM